MQPYLGFDTKLAKSQTHLINDPRYCSFKPYGGAEEAMYSKAPEVLLCGPAGTGKSRAFLEKMHLCCSKYPRMRGLMVRKTRESLTQSAMVTFEHFVVPQNGQVKWRTSEQEYRYSNGSKIIVGGMDKASKVLSSEYDFIYVQEATELEEEDWETLITRCRFGVMPYNQIVGDCNPGPPRHWLKLRANEQRLHYITSLHEDNPVFFDHDKKEWTKQGVAYIEKLSSLTGVRRKRLYEGIWAAAEGMIYEEEWNASVNLIPRRNIPRSWARIWVVDFGFTNPFVWQAWAIDEDDRLYRYAELYMTRTLVEDAAFMINHWRRRNDEPTPLAIVCDWDAEGRATLEKHLELETTPADKNVLEGIEDVKTRLKVQGDGLPRMFFLRDSSIEIDEELKDSGKPYKTEDEFDGYEWDDKKKKEQPKKEDDHGMDCVRYLSRHMELELDSWSRGMQA